MKIYVAGLPIILHPKSYNFYVFFLLVFSGRSGFYPVGTKETWEFKEKTCKVIEENDVKLFKCL